MERNGSASEEVTEEYETQYFEFGRRNMKDSLKNLVECKIHDLIQQAEDQFTSYDLDEQCKKNVRSKCAKLLDYCLNKSKIHLNEVNDVFDKYFSIPENVVLPEDENHKETSPEEVDQLINETEELKARIFSLHSAEGVLENELEEAEALNYIFDEEQTVGFVLQDMKQNFALFQDNLEFYEDEKK